MANELLAEIAAASPAKVILHRSVNAQERFYKCVAVRKAGFYQLEKYTSRQVFHENFLPGELAKRLTALFPAVYTELEAHTDKTTYLVRLDEKGIVRCRRKTVKPTPGAAIAAVDGHNRSKKYLLPDGVAIAPLVDLGVLGADGAIVPSMYDKYRQINRFLELVDDAIRSRKPEKLQIVDFGCGKSYLTFVLYYFLTKERRIPTTILGLGLKEQVVADCNALAQKYGYENLSFAVGDIAGYSGDIAPDMVLTLHACDTATDYALFQALRWQSPMILSVPCCQHELNRQMRSEHLTLLTRYGIVKERTAALLTDAIRAALLEACGYKVQLLEFVDLAHTPKNLLIRAERLFAPSPAKRQRAREEVEALCREFHLKPTLAKLLSEADLW